MALDAYSGARPAQSALRPFPQTVDGLRAIQPAVRAKSDPFQARLFVANHIGPGDGLAWSRRGQSGFGTVDRVVHTPSGDPVFLIGDLAIDVWSILPPQAEPAWFLVPGDEVEVLEGGRWMARTIEAVLSSRQFPVYRMKGNRRLFSPRDVRLPASAA